MYGKEKQPWIGKERIPYDFLSRILGGTPFTGTCTIVNNGLSLTTTSALIDTGASGYLFVNLKFARRLVKYLQPRQITDFLPSPVGGFSGKPEQLVDVALIATIRLKGRTELSAPLMVLDMKHDMIIGQRWLEHHDIFIDCKRRELIFPPEWGPGPKPNDIPMDPQSHSQRNPEWEEDIQRRDRAMAMEDKRRMDGRRAPRTIAFGVEETTDPEVVTVELTAPKTILQRPTTPPTQTPRTHNRPTSPCAHEREQQASLDKMQRSIDGRSVIHQSPQQATTRRERPASPSTSLHDAQGTYTLERDGVGFYKRYVDVAVVGALSFAKTASLSDQALGVTNLYEIDRIVAEKKEAERKEALPYDEDELRRKALELVPEDYHEYLNEFSKFESNQLADHRYIDHHIHLKEGSRPEDLGYSPLYKMSLGELEECRRYIVDNLKKGFIESSTAPWAAPVLFVPKANGALRFCVDYRKLNALTKRDQYPLPLIEETLAQIAEAKIFTKIDIRQAFHKIRLARAEDEELTTFRTRYGSYKYKVVPFGLTNGPATFQRFINDTLRGYLDDFCHAYIDDILIYSASEKEHKKHVRLVLERLRQAGLQADLAKCEFHVTRTKYLGFIVSTEGVAVDPDKIVAVKDWEPPRTVKEVQSFLGFCNFYRKFVPEYSRLAKPLTNLTRKDQPWQWREPESHAFEALKTALMSAPLLRHFQQGLETQVETDASGGVVAGVLQQRQEDDHEWHPVAYYSESMQGAELNYPIHDKELKAVVRALELWRAELVGLDHFEIVTDHRALVYFMEKRLLNQRQANWAGTLSGYSFTMTYRPGTENTVADALSRKAQELRTLKSRQEAERTMAMFKWANADETHAVPILSNIDILNALETAPEPPPLSGVLLTDALLKANLEDPALEAYRQKAREAIPNWTFQQDYVLYKNRLVVSDADHLRTRVIDDAHSRLLAGHPGKNKTRRTIATAYWWPGLHQDVDTFVANCPCRSSKDPRDKPPGLLRPLPVPLRPWHHIIIDFKSMPRSKRGHDNTFNIIDKLTKETWSTACFKSVTSRDVAEMFYNGPFRVHGLPLTVGSDRGPQFVADFTNEMSKILGINWKLSSSGHSQSAGQIENYHEWMDQRLRMFVNHHQDNWDDMLPALDVAQASTPHDALDGMTPFEVSHGFPMPLAFHWENRTTAMRDMTTRERLSRIDAQTTAQTMKDYVDTARESLKRTQERMANQANKGRREPDFGVGDKVFILKKTWSTDRPSDKLDFPLTRQAFRIKAMKGYSYELEVPSSWRMTTIFHADRLRLCPDNPLPGQDYARPEAEDISGEDEWEVDRVLSSRIYRGKLQYQVQWRGWDPDPEWYPASNFRNAPDCLKAFHDAYPEAAGPPLRLSAWSKAHHEEVNLEDHKDDDRPQETGTRQWRRSNRKRGG